MSLKYNPNPLHEQDLDAVITLSEAARRYYRDKKTLRYAIDIGKLSARKCGRITLISVASMEENYPIRG